MLLIERNRDRSTFLLLGRHSQLHLTIESVHILHSKFDGEMSSTDTSTGWMICGFQNKDNVALTKPTGYQLSTTMRNLAVTITTSHERVCSGKWTRADAWINRRQLSPCQRTWRRPPEKTGRRCKERRTKRKEKRDEREYEKREERIEHLFLAPSKQGERPTHKVSSPFRRRPHYPSQERKGKEEA